MVKNSAPVEIFVLSYNRAEYLRDCLRSILNQTFANFTVTVLDNHSEQNITDVVESFHDNRLKLIVNPTNIGSAANFRKALNLAGAEHVILFHDDDCMHPKLIETQFGLFKRKPDSSFVTVNANFVQDSSRMNIFTEDVDEVFDYYRSPRDLINSFFGSGVIGFGATMYRTDIVKKVKDDTKRFANIVDRPYLVELTKHGPSARLLDSAYYNVRCHPEQDSGTSRWTYINEIEVARYYMDFAEGVDAKSFCNKIIRMVVQQYAVRSQRGSLRIWLRELKNRGLLYKLQLLKYLPFYLFRDTLIRLFKVMAPDLYRRLAFAKLRLKSKQKGKIGLNMVVNTRVG